VDNEPYIDPVPAQRPLLTRGTDGLLDVVVVVLATWTVVYHLCLVTHVAVTGALGLEVVLLVCWVTAAVVARSRRHRPRHRHRHRHDGTDDATDATDATDESGAGTGATALVAPAPPRAAERALLVLTAAAAVAAAASLALRVTWPVVATLWLTAAVGGSVWATLRLARHPGAGGSGQQGSGHDHEDDDRSRSEGGDGDQDGVLVALAWAVALAVLAMFTRRPNPDDLYYVNLSQWVVDHGTFPLRDTIFSDQVFPMSSWPPVASYDALMGVFARLAGVPAGSVVYVVVPPVATFLAVLALWRLLRAWRVPLVPVALSVGLAFLLLDAGGLYATPGDLFLTRIWQGKVILLCLLVPTLLVYALRHVERPTWGSAGRLLVGGVAAVGLSTTAIFLVPLLAVGGAAPLLLRHPRLALRGFAAMAVYPLAAGAVTVALHGHSADDFGSRELYRFKPEWFGHDIFLTGTVAFVAVTAVLVGPFLVPHPAARLTTALLAVAVGITFVPGVTHVTYGLVGLGPTLWRVSWVASVAALVGAAGAALASCRALRAARHVAPLLLVVALAVAGTPIWSEEAGVVIRSPPHWQRSASSMTAARAVIDALEPGDVVLATPDLATTIDVTTTRVKTVAPRTYFMDYLGSAPGFHLEARTTLMNFIDSPNYHADHPAVLRALAVVAPSAVCVRSYREGKVQFLRNQGYRPLVSTSYFTCLAPGPAAGAAG
jgi:hypothetical protein